MKTRLIDDPSSLGWDYDPATGRWTWGGQGDGGSGGGGSFPEAPVDGKQYGRQDASWTEVVAVESGEDGEPSNDPRITDTQNTEWDASYEWGNHAGAGYLTSFNELDPTVPDHVKAITANQISAWDAGTGGGGGGGNDPRITATQISNWDTAFGWGSHAAAGYATQSWVTGKGYATQSWVTSNYQPKGSYLTQSNLTGYATQSWVSSNYASIPTLASYYTGAQCDSKYQPKGASSGFSGSYSAATPALFTCTASDGSAFIVKGASSARGPELRLQGASAGVDSYVRSSTVGKFEIVNGTYSAVTFSVDSAGNMRATGDVTAYSDERLKENIEVVGTGLLDEVRGVEFNWKKDGRKSSGVIAQDIQKVFPHLVTEAAGTDPDDREENTLTVNYAGLTAYLIEELKDCRRRIADLEEAQK